MCNQPIILPCSTQHESEACVLAWWSDFMMIIVADGRILRDLDSGGGGWGISWWDSLLRALYPVKMNSHVVEHDVSCIDAIHRTVSFYSDFYTIWFISMIQNMGRFCSNKDHQLCSLSLLVKFGTTDLASSLGTNGLVKQKNFVTGVMSFLD